MLAALLTFQDQSEEIHNGNNIPVLNVRNQSGDAPPVKSPVKSGADVVEEIQVKAGVCYILRFASFISLRSNSRHSRTRL
jgi:hypothetical protein